VAYHNANIYSGYAARAYEVSLAVSALSTAGEEYIARVGFGDNVTGGADTEGAGHLYDRLNIGANLQLKTIKTAGGAGNTVVDCGAVPTAGTTGAEWSTWRGEISSGGTRFDAWVDQVQKSPVGGMANLPADQDSQIRANEIRRGYGAISETRLGSDTSISDDFEVMQ
jgi:hypothetical protein